MTTQVDILEFDLLTSDPGSPTEGQFWYNTTEKSLKSFQSGVVQVAVAHSNLSASVAPTATDDSADGFSVGSTWIDTTADSSYVCVDATASAAVWKSTSSSAASSKWKDPVELASAANITALTGVKVVDGASTGNGLRILVKNQTSSIDNGIYVSNSAGAWSRATDADAAGELDYGYAVMVLNAGASGKNKGSSWFVSTAGSPTPGTDAINFTQAPAPGANIASVVIDGANSAGTSPRFAAEDHVHTVQSETKRKIKDPVFVATTANITLSGSQTIDGIGSVSSGRVLVKDQTNQVENGIYDASAGAWTRSTDADAFGDLDAGTVVVVSDGGSQFGTIWIQVSAVVSQTNPTPGTDAIVFRDATSLLSETLKAPQYLTLANHANLPNERALAAGKNLSLTDAGAGSTATMAEAPSSRILGAVITDSPSVNQANYNPTNWDAAEPSKATILRMTPSASIAISGLVGGVAGRLALLTNASTDYLVILEEQSASATAANRFSFRDPVFLMPGESVSLVYDATMSRWIAATETDDLPILFDEFTDFFGSGLGSFVSSTSGTGAAVAASTYLADSTEKPKGTISLSAGTTATGRAHIGTSQNASVVPTLGTALFLTRVAVANLSSGTQRYQIFAGFQDSVGGTNVTDGAYWLYNDASDAKWQMAAAKASSRTLTPVTGLTVDTNYIWLGVFVNAAWTRADYFYSTNSVAWSFAGSISTGNMPNAVGNTTGFGVAINKTIGTTARLAHVDLLGVRYDLVRG